MNAIRFEGKQCEGIISTRRTDIVTGLTYWDDGRCRNWVAGGGEYCPSCQMVQNRISEIAKCVIAEIQKCVDKNEELVRLSRLPI